MTVYTSSQPHQPHRHLKSEKGGQEASCSAHCFMFVYHMVLVWLNLVHMFVCYLVVPFGMYVRVTWSKLVLQICILASSRVGMYITYIIPSGRDIWPQKGGMWRYGTSVTCTTQMTSPSYQVAWSH